MSLPFNHGYSYQPYTPQHPAIDQSQQPHHLYGQNQYPGGSVVNPVGPPGPGPGPGPQMMNPNNNIYVPTAHNIPDYVDEHSQAFFHHQQHQYQHHIQQQHEHSLSQASSQNSQHQPYPLKSILETPPGLYPPPNVPISIDLIQGHQMQPQTSHNHTQSSTPGVPHPQPSNFNQHGPGPYSFPYYANQYPSPSQAFVQRHLNLMPQKHLSDVGNQYPQLGTIRPLFQNKSKSEPASNHQMFNEQSPYAGGSGAGVPIGTFGASFTLGSLKPPVVNHFKPIETKKNLRPRINKIIKREQQSSNQKKYLKKRINSGIYGELSIDSLFNHFQDVMKIESPYPKAGLGFVSSSFQLKLKSDLECQLFDLFVHSLSKSIDIFLPQEAFKKIVPELALYDDTNMILDSMFCLSSLMLQRIRPDKIDPSIPIKYYQRSIKSIRSYLSIPGIESNDKGIISRCLLSTILLCIYEMFFVAIDSTYVKGASSILSSILSKHNLSNPSLLKNSPFHQTCFWAMFLCDLILSLKFNLPSMYSINSFWKKLDPEYFELYNNYSNQLLSNNHEDREIFVSNSMLNKEHTMWWLHKSLINFSSINEFNNLVDVITFEDFSSNKPYYDWLELRTLIDEYETYMPINLKPTIYKPCSMDRIFPLIYFKDEVTAIIGLNFKLSKIALYESLLLNTNIDDALVQEELAKYPANYAKKLTKDIIGIMKTYDRNLFVWPVNVHTLRQVAHYVFDEPEAFKVLEELVERVLDTCNLKLLEKIVPR